VVKYSLTTVLNDLKIELMTNQRAQEQRLEKAQSDLKREILTSQREQEQRLEKAQREQEQRLEKAQSDLKREILNSQKEQEERVTKSFDKSLDAKSFWIVVQVVGFGTVVVSGLLSGFAFFGYYPDLKVRTTRQ
jgi:multidrug efflux pump subunit AcrA (membrane-fusion protein)